VWITPISTCTAQKILSHSHTSTKTLTPWLVASLFPSLLLGLPSDCPQGRRPDQDSVHHPIWSIHIQDYILQAEERKSYISSSHPAIYALPINYTAMLKPTWMMWSLRPETTTSSSLTSRKPSIACACFGGSSTQPSASSAYIKENYSVPSSVTEELKPTRRRLLPP
jgi:hypothetical protein